MRGGGEEREGEERGRVGWGEQERNTGGEEMEERMKKEKHKEVSKEGLPEDVPEKVLLPS